MFVGLQENVEGRKEGRKAYFNLLRGPYQAIFPFSVAPRIYLLPLARDRIEWSSLFLRNSCLNRSFETAQKCGVSA